MRLFTDLMERGSAPAAAGSAAGLLAPFLACGCPACAGEGGNAPQAGATPGQPVAPLSSNAGTAGDAAALASGSQWGGRDAGGQTVITYSFSNAGSVFDGESTQFSASLAAFSAQDRATTRALLATISAVCNVTFVEVADNGGQSGQVRYGYSQAPNAMGYAGYAFFPSEAATGGDVWIGTAQTAAQWDFYRPGLILHETLHAIGLKHPFAGGVTLASAADIIPNTVMSYSPVAGTQQGSLSQYPVEPMALDIQMLQALYGAAAHNDGNTVYDLADAGFRNFRAVWDSAGTDTLDASRVGAAVSLDLNDGARSDIGVRIGSYALFNGTPSYGNYTATLALAPGTRIENAVGSAFSDSLVGNAFGNILIGAGGDDRIDGGAGNDTVDGGAGNDTIEGGVGIDTLVAAFLPSQYRYAAGTLSSPEGHDSLQSMELVRFGSAMGAPFTSDLTLDQLVDPDGAGPWSSPATSLLESISDLYVAYFNRGPDVSGLLYWFRNVSSGEWRLDDVASSFTDQAEYLQAYPQGTNNRDFIAAIYQNLFDRVPDQEGWDYWVGDLESGVPRDSFILRVIRGAYAPTGDADDKLLLIHKHQTSLYYTEQLALHPGEAFDPNIDQILNRVSADPATVAHATEVVDFLMNSPVTLTGLSNDTAQWEAFWS